MKRAVVVALVAVALLTGIPVVMGMPLMECADCDLGTVAASSCILAVLTAMVALALSTPNLAALLASSGLYRPPRLA